MKRRKVILMAGMGAAIVLTGCNSGSDTAIEIDTTSPETVVESFRKVFDRFDQESSEDEILNAVRPALHSASPFPSIIEEWEDSSYITHDVASIEANVIDKNLGADRLHRAFETGLASITEEAIESITEKNAVVEASLEYEEAPDGTQRYLTAPENGDWLIVV